MHLESGALIRLVIARPLQVNDGVEHVFALAGAARCNAAAAGVIDEQHGLIDAPQPEKPLLHGVPDLGVILSAAVNESRSVVEEDHLGLDLLDQGLVQLRRQIEQGAGLLLIHRQDLEGVGIGVAMGGNQPAHALLHFGRRHFAIDIEHACAAPAPTSGGTCRPWRWRRPWPSAT